MKSRRPICISICSTILSFAATGQSAVTFQGLPVSIPSRPSQPGFADYPAYVGNAHPIAVAGNGSTISGQVFQGVGGDQVGFILSNGNVAEIPYIGGTPGTQASTGSTAGGISADGTLITGFEGQLSTNASQVGVTGAVYHTDATFVHGFTSSGGAYAPVAISGNGLVTVGADNNLEIYSPAIDGVSLGSLGTTRSAIVSAKATNFDGSIAVGGANTSIVLQTEAFRWTQATGMVGIGFLSGFSNSVATGLSNDGNTITGTASNTGSSKMAFRWTAASNSMTPLGTLPGQTTSNADGISSDGNEIVGTSGNHAFLWTPSLGMIDLQQYLTSNGTDLTGWTLEEASAITPDGATIVGWGLDAATGFDEPFKVTIDPNAVLPEPTCLALVTIPAALLLRRRRV